MLWIPDFLLFKVQTYALLFIFLGHKSFKEELEGLLLILEVSIILWLKNGVYFASYNSVFSYVCIAIFK